MARHDFVRSLSFGEDMSRHSEVIALSLYRFNSVTGAHHHQPSVVSTGHPTPKPRARGSDVGRGDGGAGGLPVAVRASHLTPCGCVDTRRPAVRGVTSMHGTKHAWVTACRCIEERRHGGGRPAEIAVGTWMAHPTVIGHGNVLPKKKTGNNQRPARMGTTWRI